MCKLIRGGEIELAVSVGLVLKSVDAQLRVALELLSRRCENLGRWSVMSLFAFILVLLNYTVFQKTKPPNFDSNFVKS